MCLAVPMRITEIDGKEATVSSAGLSRKIRVDFIQDPKIGDYVIVHAGFAIERLPEQQARDDIMAWEEMNAACSRTE